MWGAQLVGSPGMIDDPVTQAVLASMATAFSISFSAMTELAFHLVDAKTQEEVDRIFSKYVTTIENVGPTEFADMTFLRPHHPPFHAFSHIASQWPFDVPNTSGMMGWSVPVHEWFQRPR